MRKPLLVAVAAMTLGFGAVLMAIGAASAATASAPHCARRSDGAASTVLRSRLNSSVQDRIVVDSSGYTLYTWFHGQGHYGSARYNTNFPPLIAHGRVLAACGSKIDGYKLGTRKLSDGQRQVTYHGQPLYLYDGDHKPGQANGERQQQDNGVWFAVRSDGHPAFPTY